MLSYHTHQYNKHYRTLIRHYLNIFQNATQHPERFRIDSSIVIASEYGEYCILYALQV